METILPRDAARRVHGIRLAIVVLSLCTAACGGGGGGGGDGSDGGDADLQVGPSATFLSRDEGAPANADPRTSHRVQFTLHGLANPEERLTDDALEVRRDGRVDVEARVSLANDATVKRDLTLILDVSGSLTPEDLQNVKESARKFMTEVLPVTGTLRVYTFASRSETHLVGEYVATGTAATGYAWMPSPTADIDAIRGGSDSTALFHAVRTAILADTGSRDVLVVFSDGQENSSPAGAREQALQAIADDGIIVFSVGFGRVDADDLRALSRNGRFVGVRASLVGLFDEVSREVRSVYTLVYDTPAAFGSLTLDVRVEAERRRFRFETSLLAGVDLARAAIGRFPTLPGSSVTLRDLRTSPPSTTTYTVAPLEAATRRADGLLAFAVDSDPGCTGSGCGRRFQGVLGEGAESESDGVYVPAALTKDVTWTDAVSGQTFTFVGFEEQVFFRGTPDQRKYACAVVEFAGGRHWLAPEIGLVRTVDTAGNVLVELDAPPCLATDFTGGCSGG